MAGAFQYLTIQRLKRADFLVAHTHEVMAEAEGAYSDLQRVESGGRGYVASGDEAYVRQYDAGVSRSSLHLNALRRLTADNPRQQHHLNSLAPLIQRKIAFNQELIGLRRQGRIAPSGQLLAQGEGLKLMDEIRDGIDAMLAEERILLVDRLTLRQHRANIAYAALVLGVLLALILSVFAGLIIRRDFWQRQQAQEALSKEKYLLDTLMDNLPDLIYFKDRESRFTRINQAQAKLFGLTEPAQAVGKNDFDYFAAQHAQPAYDDEQEIIRTGQPKVGIEEEETWPDGHARWVSTTKMPLRDPSGSIIGTFGVSRDLTERKRAEEMRAYLASIVESSDDAIIGKNTEGIIQSWNEGAEKLYGYSAAEAIGRSLDIIVPTEKRDEFEGFLNRIKRGEGIKNYETARVTRSGLRIAVSVTISPLRIRSSEVIGASAVARDITERKQAEASLRKSEERFRLIAETIDEVFRIDEPDISRIAYISPAYERVWGRTRTSLIENPSTFFEAIHPEDRERVIAVLENERAGKPFEHEYRVLHTDGSTRWILDRGFPVRDEAGELSIFVGVAQDITERKRLEEQFRQAQKMEAVGRLAGGIAHDFNNLLTIINGYSDLVMDGLKSNDPMRGHLEEVKKAGDRAASLTQQMLAFSRKQVLVPSVLDLNIRVGDMEKMLRRLIGEDIDLAIVRDPALGQVKADSGQIDQILLNLAVNARDAMPEGGKLVIETSNIELDEAYVRSHVVVSPGRYVMLAVSDSGIGMDPETQAHIFEPFFTTKGQGKGTGLGLAMVYGTVKQSGGYIWVYSEPGHGTTFKIYLPRVDEEDGTAQVSESPEHLVTGTETILLVEDEEAVRALAAIVLQQRGYKMLVSTSPEDAIRIGTGYGEPIHLLLTDVVLPGMSGRKISEELALFRPGMKVLYMSGYTDDAIVRHGALEANVAFLQKPFTPAALARKVREVLDDGRDQSS